MPGDIRTGKHELASLQRNTRQPVKRRESIGGNSSLAGAGSAPSWQSSTVAGKAFIILAGRRRRPMGRSNTCTDRRNRFLGRTQTCLARRIAKAARLDVNIEHAPSIRRLDIPLARLRQCVKTGQQGIINLLTRISQIPERLIAVQPHTRTGLRAEATVRNRHLTSATFNAQAAARAIEGLFIVYTCSPSTPCSCRSVSCLQAYSTPACRKLSASFS